MSPNMNCTKGLRTVRRKLRGEIIIMIRLLQSEFSNNIYKALRNSSVEESYYCAVVLFLKHLHVCQITMQISVDIPSINIFFKLNMKPLKWYRSFHHQSITLVQLNFPLALGFDSTELNIPFQAHIWQFSDLHLI